MKRKHEIRLLSWALCLCMLVNMLCTGGWLALAESVMEAVESATPAVTESAPETAAPTEAATEPADTATPAPTEAVTDAPATEEPVTAAPTDAATPEPTEAEADTATPQPEETATAEPEPTEPEDDETAEPEMATAEPETETEAPTQEPLYGDVDGDGQVTPTDLRSLLQAGYTFREAQGMMPLTVLSETVKENWFRAELWSDGTGTQKETVTGGGLLRLAAGYWPGVPSGALCDEKLRFRADDYPAVPGYTLSCVLYNDAYVTFMTLLTIGGENALYLETLTFDPDHPEAEPEAGWALLTAGARMMLRYVADEQEPVVTETPEPTDTPEPTGTPEPTDTPEPAPRIVLTFRELDVMTLAAIMPYASLDGNAVQLVIGENLGGVTLSYFEGGNWIEINEGNAGDLDASKEYRASFNYYDIKVEDLLAANGQMVYGGLPSWFKPKGGGLLLNGNDEVGRIECVNGMIVMIFDMDWLSSHRGDTLLSGSFRVGGTVDWHELPQDGSDTGFDGLGFGIGFEDGLAQKYGDISLTKSEPKLVLGDDGCYYLQYVLTVISGEDVVIPEVKVADGFTESGCIEGYVGVPAAELPKEDPGEMNPYEQSDAAEPSVGQLLGSGSGMEWVIGDLQPRETRTLTYYAKIDQNYLDSLSNTTIENKAAALAGNTPKKEVSSSFTPKVSAKIRKTANADETPIGPDGSGAITYTVTITVPNDNSFILSGMTLEDAFPAQYKDYLSGDGDGIELDISVTLNGVTETRKEKVPYGNASFALNDLTLEPGAEITITYTINVEHIFLSSNDQVELTNVASIGKGGRTLTSDWNTETLEKNIWARKLVGDYLKNAEEIPLTPGDVYDATGGKIERIPSPETNFTVPVGSVQYQVVLNENGYWDMSSTTLRDTFGEPAYMQYVGYVRVQLFKRAEGSSNDLQDGALIGELNKLEAVKTVWLKVDGKSSFSFEPSQLGLNDKDIKDYTFLLTYYAEPCNLSDVGDIVVSNRFRLEGKVGPGNGSFVQMPGIEVSVGKVVQGNIKYSGYKSFWYYEPADSVYQPALQSDYKNGALYWVIKLEGNIKQGKAVSNATGNAPTGFSGFYVKDKLAGSQQFVRDAVMGVFIISKDVDVTAYDDYASFVATFGGQEKMNGNPQNDKFFQQTADPNAKYKWYARSSELDGLVFTADHDDLEENGKAIYIVLRSAMLKSPADAISEAFDNDLYFGQGNSTIFVNRDTFAFKTTLFKESKGAYIYNKETGKVIQCSTTGGGDWSFDKLVPLDQLPGTGTYAAWLLNVNWNGQMVGTTDLSDQLPEGMELVYVGVNNLGKETESSPPVTRTIPELYASPNWVEKVFSDGTISYYNPTTREIRWRIDNLTQGEKYRLYAINLRVICRVTDPVLEQNKTYVNYAALLDTDGTPFDLESASVTIVRELDKSLNRDSSNVTEDNQGNVSVEGNKLPFQIAINSEGEDMAVGDTLPALIDVISGGVELIEDSLRVTYANGSEFKNYTYDLETGDGQQRLIIHGLPDNTPLVLSYSLRIIAEPGVPVTGISNLAYWAGYQPPDDAQVKIPSARYEPSGDVFAQYNIKVNITKVDADSHAKKLDGAAFELWEVDANGEPATKIREGVTDSYGKIVFVQGKPDLSFDKVYCIVETAAPIGYEVKGDARHYFMVVSPGEAKVNAAKQERDRYEQALNLDLDLWFDDPEYKLTVENVKKPISVNKIFVDEHGQPMDAEPTSGSFRFGLFDFDDKLLEVLTITYTAEGPTYLLNGVERETPTFSKNDPEQRYHVYELDDTDAPVADDSLAMIDGAYYRVNYAKDVVSAGGTMDVTNQHMAQPDDQSLTILKNVRGQGAPKDRAFTFEVTLTGVADGAYPIDGNPTSPAGDTIVFKQGKAEVKLAHGEYIIISGLPADAAYTVREMDATGYDCEQSGETGEIPAAGTATATFTNYLIQQGNDKTVDDADGVVDPGQELTYTIRWANNQPMPAEVTITDVLPEGLTLVRVSGSGIVGADGRTITWYLGEHGAYTSGSVTVTVTVTAGYDTAITNGATIQIGDKSYEPKASVRVREEEKKEDPAPATVKPTNTAKPSASPKPTNTTPAATPTPGSTASPTPKPTVSGTPGPTPSVSPTGPDSVPKTGDDSLQNVWLLLMLASFLGMAVTALCLRKRLRTRRE